MSWTGVSVSSAVVLAAASLGGTGVYLTDSSRKEAALARFHELIGGPATLEEKSATRMAALYNNAVSFFHPADKNLDGHTTPENVLQRFGENSEMTVLMFLVLALTVTMIVLVGLATRLRRENEKRGTLTVVVVTASGLQDDAAIRATVTVDGISHRTEVVKTNSKTASFAACDLQFPVLLSKDMKAGEKKLSFELYRAKGLMDRFDDMLHLRHETVGILSVDLKDVITHKSNGFEKELSLEAPNPPASSQLSNKPQPAGKLKFKCAYTAP